MPFLDLDALPTVVQACAGAQPGAGLTWQLHRGPVRTAPLAGPHSAWVDCHSATAFGRLIVWDDGRVHLEVGHLATGAVRTAHDQLRSTNELSSQVARLAAWVSR